MKKPSVSLTPEQISEHDILQRVIRREMSTVHAAELLHLTPRTIRRKKDLLLQYGPAALIHGLTGKRSNARIHEDEEVLVGSLLKEKYSDFGPTFAAEKLRELHGINRSSNTIQRIMEDIGLWSSKKHKASPVHREWRMRRSCFGELVQFDGSYEWWLEDRYPLKLCLLAAIDDATGKILFARFEYNEGVFPVMRFWQSYIEQNGVPQSIYLDRFSTYSMNVKAAKENPDTATQFERAAKDLGINLIHALSPQAKGRVERLFETLQDRLVKELRLAGINTPEDANIFLEKTYIDVFNQRFAKEAAKQGDLHRTLGEKERATLPLILCRREQRVLQNDFTISYKSIRYQLLSTPRLLMRPKDEVLVHELPDATIRLFIRNKEAPWKKIKDRNGWAGELAAPLPLPIHLA